MEQYGFMRTAIRKAVGGVKHDDKPGFFSYRGMFIGCHSSMTGEEMVNAISQIPGIMPAEPNKLYPQPLPVFKYVFENRTYEVSITPPTESYMGGVRIRYVGPAS